MKTNLPTFVKICLIFVAVSATMFAATIFGGYAVAYAAETNAESALQTDFFDYLKINVFPTVISSLTSSTVITALIATALKKVSDGSKNFDAATKSVSDVALTAKKQVTNIVTTVEELKQDYLEFKANLYKIITDVAETSKIEIHSLVGKFENELSATRETVDSLSKSFVVMARNSKELVASGAAIDMIKLLKDKGAENEKPENTVDCAESK